jgi:hypothetical protein
VALPLHVTDDLHAPGTLLGLYWMLFGIGAVLGGLAVGALRQLPLWRVTVVIVVAWGLALLPFGFDVPTAVTVACFTLGGAIYGPFVALSVTLMQAKSPPQHLAAMLAARSAALLTASPLWPDAGTSERESLVRQRQAACATAGMPSYVAKQVTRPIRNREAPLTEPHVA